MKVDVLTRFRKISIPAILIVGIILGSGVKGAYGARWIVIKICVT